MLESVRLRDRIRLPREGCPCQAASSPVRTPPLCSCWRTDGRFEACPSAPPVRPSARPHWLEAVLGAVARWLVAFHEGVGEPARPLEGERFEALVLEPFERYLEAFAVGPRERRFLERVRRRAEGLRGVRLSVVPQHGDLCAANVFLGGGGSRPSALAAGAVFGLKALALLLVLSIVSALYARLRIDQLADLGWKVLAPLALVQTLFTLWIGAR